MAKEERVKPKETGVRGVVLLAVAAVGATLALFFATRAKAAPGEYVCPYCGATFATFEELVAHVQSVHPGERLPLEIIWTS